ncbi:DeoR/GlpR family DNA-binding transcription regulator [Feifania hominis]|uniref:DeoR/GlpR transcriptional regulator n=1 Tax=Feifania hominis TaxID=2763660 RepID=A0A926DFI4_9FIRM|nr:DeoR/GlpR family DNA-binding transcription regulator [Feifania hominis]MBC8536907.1 DeoR/GlpR transcriptional regulator [Feifania hominis]
MYNIERKEEIINLLERDGEVDVNTLAGAFGISRETVRRDLRELEQDGILTRTHGGAVYNRERRDEQNEYPVAIRGIQRYSEKNEICKYAAALIEEGDTIFVDNSSTTMYLVRYIPRELHITVVTNSLKLLLEAAALQNPNIHFICFGGSFKESNLSFYGNTTLKNAEAYYPNKAFLSCAGIREDGLVTDASMQEVDTKRLMLDHCRKSYFLVDYTKFTSAGQVFLTRLSHGDTVITDQRVDQRSLDFVAALGAEVKVV